MAISTGGKVLLISGGALITYLVGREVFARTRPRPPIDACSPYTWDHDAVSQTIEALIAEGLAIDEVVVATAQEHFGQHPSGTMVSFPPSNGLPGVQCVWQKVNELVQRIWAETGPPIDYADLVEQFESPDGDPEMGTLYDYGSGIPALANVSRRALQNAGVPSHSDNRIAYLRLIECSPYNDALYNVKLPVEDGIVKMGRFRRDPAFGISGNPQHYDNLLRMKQGLAPRRAALRNSLTKVSEGVPGGRRHADFWLPLLKPGTEIVGPGAVATWQDGSSAINPPPEILALGMENVPPGQYGCDPWRTSVEEL